MSLARGASETDVQADPLQQALLHTTVRKPNVELVPPSAQFMSRGIPRSKVLRKTLGALRLACTLAKSEPGVGATKRTIYEPRQSKIKSDENNAECSATGVHVVSRVSHESNIRVLRATFVRRADLWVPTS